MILYGISLLKILLMLFRSEADCALQLSPEEIAHSSGYITCMAIRSRDLEGILSNAENAWLFNINLSQTSNVTINTAFTPIETLLENLATCRNLELNPDCRIHTINDFLNFASKITSAADVAEMKKHLYMTMDQNEQELEATAEVHSQFRP